MSVYYADDLVTLHLGDCLDVLPTLADASVDAVVCDPPYGLADHHPTVIAQALSAWLAGDRAHVPNGRGFMGKEWDRFVPPPAAWDECLRVLKPGGHLVAFAAPRTVDLMTLSIRLAGFEIRDSLHWIYGSGFPKSHDVSKAIDNAAGAERQVIGHTKAGASSLERVRRVEQGYRSALTNVDTSAIPITVAATVEAAQWAGWGTALKPAHEPIVLARKSLAGTVAAAVLLHGTGALNIDACRTEAAGRPSRTAAFNGYEGDTYGSARSTGLATGTTDMGRWPANILLGHGPDCAAECQPGCPVAEMDRQSGVTGGNARANKGERHGAVYGGGAGPSGSGGPRGHDDHGGASRFFPVFRYEAKAPASERPRLADGTAWPTVKPLALMQWLIRLVTPPGGLVLDPFAGSGTTLEAAVTEGFRAVGVEREQDGAELCVTRLSKPLETALFGLDP